MAMALAELNEAVEEAAAWTFNPRRNLHRSQAFNLKLLSFSEVIGSTDQLNLSLISKREMPGPKNVHRPRPATAIPSHSAAALS